MQECDMQGITNEGAQGSTIINLDPMETKLQVISSILLHKKVYISGVAVEDVPKSRHVQVYSLAKKEWSTLPEAPNYNAKIAVINGQITLIGGRDGKTKKLSNYICAWYEDEKQWKQVLPALLPSSQVANGVYYCDGLLLVSGGAEERAEVEEEYTVVKKVNVYNFTSMQWSAPLAVQLPKALRSHSLVHHGKYIYLLAGATKKPARIEDGAKLFNPHAWRARWYDVKDAVREAATVTVHPYQPVKSVWTPIADPPVLHPTAISCKHSLISVGGMKDGWPQKAIYRFVDGETSNHWITVGNMSVGRYRPAVVPLGYHGTVLFVAGGYVQNKPSEDEANVKSASTELVLL